MAPAVKLNGVQALTPDNPAFQIALPSPEFTNQRCWFEFSGIGADFQLCNTTTDVAGIPVSTSTTVVGPFRVRNAPTFCYTTAGATVATVAILLED